MGTAITVRQIHTTRLRRPVHSIFRTMKPKFVDLFCGIGVGSLGFVRMGFQPVAALDNDQQACAIYESNIGLRPIIGDIKDVSGEDVLKRSRLNQGEVDVCVGCPPCQGFSTLRQTSRQQHHPDRRKSLLRIFGDRVEELQPKVVLMENVRGLTIGPNKRFLNEFISHLHRLGYLCDFGILNAADFGVPQTRKRLILIGAKSVQPSLPTPTHSRTEDQGRLPWRTVRNTIGNLPHLRAGQMTSDIPLHAAPDHEESTLTLIRNIARNGGSRRSLPTRLWLPCHKTLERRKKEGAGSVYGRMRWDSPSPTITTRCNTPSCGRFIHPKQDRAITLREAARLQSIPDCYELTGHKSAIGRWIGNAMPLKLAEALAHQCALYL